MTGKGIERKEESTMNNARHSQNTAFPTQSKMSKRREKLPRLQQVVNDNQYASSGFYCSDYPNFADMFRGTFGPCWY